MKNLLYFFLIVSPLSLAAAPVAFQIDNDNIHTLDRGGPSAIAGLGDWWLSNGKLCVAVSGLTHDAGIVAGGGSLVDISHCDLRNDQFLNTNILAGMAKDDALQASAIAVENNADSAAIVTSGEKDGIRQTVTYSLAEDSTRLTMTVSLRRIDEGPRLGMSAILTLHPSGTLTPFSAGTDGRGFRHDQVDVNSILNMLESMTASDTAYLLGNALESQPISYRMQLHAATLTRQDGSRHSLPIFQMAVDDYVMQGWLTRPVLIGGGAPGIVTFAQMPLMDLRSGEVLQAVFHIDAAATSDVDGFRVAEPLGVRLHGTAPAGTAIAVYNARGEALSQTRADSAGKYTVALPEARAYQLDVTSPQGELRTLQVRGGSDTVEFDIPALAPGTLILPRGEVMRLTFKGVDGTADPVFRGAGSLLRLGDSLAAGSLRSNSIVLAGTGDDPTSVPLPVGRYRVLASRGLDYGVSETRLNIASRGKQPLTITAPLRQVLRNNTVSADFHVHSSVSFDSVTPRRSQLRRFHAAGGEVLVFTEHNRIGPLQQPTDLPLQIINGLEITGTARTRTAPTTIGHSNAFPASFDALAYRGGSPRVEERRLRDVMADVRQRWPGTLLQLNHPRSPHSNDADLAFFNHLSQGRRFDPRVALGSDDNALLLQAGVGGSRDIDFDLIEILNGSEIVVYERVRNDWLALLGAGYRKVATANSDSHAWKTPIGVPVNRVLTPQTRLPIPEDALLPAVQAGQLYGTSGAELNVALLAAETRLEPGATCRCTGAQLSVSVRAADWVDVDRINVYTRRGRIETRKIDGPGDYAIPLSFAADDFVVVELMGEPSDIYAALYPGYTPISFSNAIYIDADGSGSWTPGR